MSTNSKSSHAAEGIPEVKVVTTVNSNIETAFNYIAPVNLMHILRGNALIPAIVDTSIKEGWNKAGLTRTIFFKDGSTSQETLLTVEAPHSFSYKNERFTSKVLAALLKRLEGDWLFTDLGNNSTKIEWTYRAVPTNSFTRLLVKLILMKAIHAMLRDALSILKNDLDTNQLEKGTTWNR